MAAASLPDAWQETFLFGIEDIDGSEVQFAGITEDITGMDFGDKDVESIVVINGSRLIKRIPQGDESITLKVYPTDASTAGDGVVQLFHWQTTEDATDPIKVLNTLSRKRFQIIFLWADNTDDLSTAGGATTANHAAYRITVKNAYMTGYKPNFDDKNMSAEVTFKWAPFGREGNANKKEESTVTTAIPVKASYTTATAYNAF